MGFAGVVMAAGEGTRMRSRIPKPLHRLCGKEMVRYPVELLQKAGAERVVVIVSPDNRDALRFQPRHFFQQRVRFEHDAVADATVNVRPQNAGWNKMQHRLAAIDNERMTGIMAPLGPDHGRRPFGEQVDDLALALVSPLGAHDDNVAAHSCLPSPHIAPSR